MPYLSELDTWAQWLLTIGAAIALLVGWVRVIVPFWRNAKNDARAVRDTLVGREALRDSITGDEIKPAIPGIGIRMANIEAAVDILAKQDKRLEALEDRVTRIESGAFLERMVGKAESIQLLRTLEAVGSQHPDPDDDDPRPAA